jgi:uncharacterized oligopeptide transporter (OPT) family protein
MDFTKQNPPASPGNPPPGMPAPEPPPPAETPGAPPGAGGPRKGYREVTISAIIFGLIVGSIMNAAITYSGLKIGFTIVGSAIAAVLGFGVLRGILRKGSILETNIGQTIATAVNTTNSGVIFTVPVLLLLGYSLDPTGARFWLVTIASMAGAVMGAAFIIPLRKQMIDIDRLRFPSGTAVGAILKSPGAGLKKTIVLIIGIVVAMLIYLPTQLPIFGAAATTDNLDRLVEREKISPAQADLTREIAGWIEAEAAPPVVVQAGDIRRQIEKLRDERANLAPDAPPEAEEQLNTEIAAAETQLKALELSDAYNPELTIAASRATAGELPWTRLESTAYGWAKDPLWGYSDLNLRTGAQTDPETGELIESADRDGNGKPDLLLTDDVFDLGRAIGLPDSMLLAFAIAPFALGAGYLTGRNGLMVLAGGVLAYLILNPILYTWNLMPATTKAHEVANVGRGMVNRPLGIGMLLGGAMMGVIVSLPAIKAALRSLWAAGKVAGGSDELGLKPVALAVIGAFILLFVASDLSSKDASNTACPVTGEVLVVPVGTEPPPGFNPDTSIRPTVEYGGYTLLVADDGAKALWEGWDGDQRSAALETINAKPGLLAAMNPHLRAAIIALIGTVWIWLAGIIIAQCTGMTDWSPVSGIALLTVVLVMFLAGTGNVIAAVLVGATLCCAITMAADMMADLRTGYIVGSLPKRQQMCELATTWVGPVICMLTILVISAANIKQFGVPMGEGTPTSAPQAQALQAVINGVQGGQMPYALYALGALLGALLGLGAFAGLGVLVGLSMYLPFIYISTYGIGCILNILIGKLKGRTWAEEWGVPFAAGLIVGEAILALFVNGLVLAGVGQ